MQKPDNRFSLRVRAAAVIAGLGLLLGGAELQAAPAKALRVDAGSVVEVGRFMRWRIVCAGGSQSMRLYATRRISQPRFKAWPLKKVLQDLRARLQSAGGRTPAAQRNLKKRLRQFSKMRRAAGLRCTSSGGGPSSNPSSAPSSGSSSSASQFPADYASSLTQHGITWTFDRPYAVGQFVNGDWWVIGPLTVTAIDPAPVFSRNLNNQHIIDFSGAAWHEGSKSLSKAGAFANFVSVASTDEVRIMGGSGVRPGYYFIASSSADTLWLTESIALDSETPPGFSDISGQVQHNGRNGSAINPMPGVHHGYDGRHVSYLESLGQNPPFRLLPGESLVSTISTLFRRPLNPPLLKTAAVLSCLEAAPPPDAFRPPYSGVEKPLRLASALQVDLLPALQPSALTPPLADVERLFERVWLDHRIGWAGRSLHPEDNMKDYGRGIAQDVGVGALMLLLNPQTIGDKSRLLHLYVQLGIDLYGIARSGGYWPCDGGHAPGRKWPIVFAGLMLGDAAMRNIGTSVRFGEDDQTFYVRQADVDLTHGHEFSGEVRAATSTTLTLAENHPATYSVFVDGNRLYITGGRGAGQMRVATAFDTQTKVATVSPPWDIIPDQSSTYYVPGYEADQIGMPEFGIRHFENPAKDNAAWNAPYRILNHSRWYGFTLAARVLGQVEAWGHAALFDYMDRVAAIEGPAPL